jgi:hypothetical protein
MTSVGDLSSLTRETIRHWSWQSTIAMDGLGCALGDGEALMSIGQ